MLNGILHKVLDMYIIGEFFAAPINDKCPNRMFQFCLLVAGRAAAASPQLPGEN